VESSTTNKTLKTLIFSAVFAALAIALNYLLAFTPNVKLFNLIIFMAGFWGGIYAGILTGASSSLVYFVFNPYGMAPLPLLAAQVFSMTLIGYIGGICGRKRIFETRLIFIILKAIALGFLLSVIYNVLVTAVGAYVAGTFTIAMLTFGLAWIALNILSNTIAFAVLIPLLLPLGKRFEKL
jgi:hypothetical protein